MSNWIWINKDGEYNPNAMKLLCEQQARKAEKMAHELTTAKNNDAAIRLLNTLAEEFDYASAIFGQMVKATDILKSGNRALFSNNDNDVSECLTNGVKCPKCHSNSSGLCEKVSEEDENLFDYVCILSDCGFRWIDK